MEPEKVRSTVRSTTSRWRGAAAAALCHRIFIACLLLPLAAAPAAAQETERDEVLAGSGIRYPLGYDAETEGVIEGRVLRIAAPPRGPVVIFLDAHGRPVTILTSPAWYWDRAEGKPSVGDLVQVIGSKTIGADGELYVVAREIVPVGAPCGCLFRDERGQPLWRGRMREKSWRRCAPPAREPLPLKP